MWQLWVVAGWLALGALAEVAMVGKPREPISGLTAAVSVAISAVLISLLIWSM